MKIYFLNMFNMLFQLSYFDPEFSNKSFQEIFTMSIDIYKKEYPTKIILIAKFKK